MKRFLIAVFTYYVFAGVYAQEIVPAEIAPIEAPFEMPQLQRPVFPNRVVTLSKKYADTDKLCTEVIQRAIDRLSTKGGGRLIVPAGRWLTGRIVLKSNVELHLSEGAELHFSGKISDYLPVVLTRYEGIDVYSLGAMVYAFEAENIALTGKGKLVAPSRDCEISRRQEGGVSESLNDIPLAERIVDGRDGGLVMMPVFFGPMHCKNVLVEGVTFEKSIFWNIAPTYCNRVIIRDVTVDAHGTGRTDGIDIDSSTDVLVEYVTLDCGDDCFTLKAGRSYDGVRRARPTENVVIRHCRAIRGVGGITAGSETAGMVRNVYVHDCVMENVDHAVFMKTRRPRGGGAENITLEHIRVVNPRMTAFKWDMLGSVEWLGDIARRYPAHPVGELTPVFRNFVFKDITIDHCVRFLKAVGLPESPVENICFENLQSPVRDVELQDVREFRMK